MVIIIISLFFVGYLAIALEHPLKIDKTASALLLGMLLWLCYALTCEQFVPLVNGDALAAYAAENGLDGQSLHKQALSYLLDVQIVYHLGDITQTLFFLIGAMTIVELVDVHEGFTVITNKITTRRKRLLLLVICGVTFLLSAVLDNLTTTIVMVMLLRKLLANKYERWVFASMIVIAANTGGAWSPIGDVTTIMLWVKGNVTTAALISYVLLPSVVALALPMAVVIRKLDGTVTAPEVQVKSTSVATPGERKLIFWLGIVGLLAVPVLKSVTHLPPFVCVLLVLGLLWVFTECFYNHKKLADKSRENRLGRVLKRIDMATILFFFGILMAVAVLECTGVLHSAAEWLNHNVHNVYIINIILGFLSSIVDNVPLVAAAMGMYPIESPDAVGYAANFVVDGTFWEFLSYCAGVGGSILIIGSAAGVIAMGIEKIPFGWYLKNFSLLAMLGYLAGAAVYFIESEFIKPLLM